MNIRKQRKKAWRLFVSKCDRILNGFDVPQGSARQQELAFQWWNIRNNRKAGTYERTSERKLRAAMQRAG